MVNPERTEETRAIVAGLYARYAAGDLEGAVAGMAEDIDWALVAPRHLFPFAGRRTGRAEVLETFRQIARTYEFLAYEPAIILADGDGACVYLNCVVRNLATGAGVNMVLCDVVKLKDGKVVWLRELVDTAGVAAALAEPPGAGGIGDE